jgi:AcrR family transcriptional regulator
MPAENGRVSSTSGAVVSDDAASSSAPAAGRRGLRADAQRNRQQLLAAARDVFVDLGADAPLDEVARRAGVGIATLYRRFPDRESLQRAVALDVLRQAAEAARAAETQHADALAGLGRYMHAALDLRISAVMPALLGRISLDDDEMRLARQRATEPVLRMIAAGQAANQLRADVAFGDIGTLLVRLSRPLPGGFPADLDMRLAHRHVDLFLDALRTPATPLSGPALSLEDLQRSSAVHPE